MKGRREDGIMFNNTLMRNHANMLLRNIGMILMTIGVCFLVCSVTNDNAFVTYEQSKVVVFAYTMACVWMGLFDSLPIYNDQKVYVEANFDNRIYSPLEYFMSVLVIEIVLAAIQALIASALFLYYFGEVCLLQDLVTSSGRIDLVITCFLIVLSSSCMGFWVGIICDQKYSLLLVLGILILQMMFSQCIFELPQRYEGISDVVISKYGAGSIGSLVNLNAYPLKINLDSAIQLPHPPQDIYRLSGDYIVSNWAALVVLAVIMIFLSWIAIIFKANRMRR